jgi:hypothetical protein
VAVCSQILVEPLRRELVACEQTFYPFQVDFQISRVTQFEGGGESAAEESVRLI